jgi:trigger factor
MDDNVFAVPSNFVKRQLEHMVEDAKRRLEQKGFSHEELDKKDAEFREKFKNDAVRHVRLLFVLDEIANSEHIEVNDKDVEAAYKNISLNVGKTESEVKDYYEKEELVDGLKDKIREEKTIKFLMDSADIVEVES